MFRFNLQNVPELGGTVAGFGAVHEGFGSLQQVPKRENHTDPKL